MGWNDRLPEDPFIPYENETDRDNYEAWQEYLVYLAAQTETALDADTAGLTSQNIDPVSLRRDVQEHPNADRQANHQTSKQTDRLEERIPAHDLEQT